MAIKTLRELLEEYRLQSDDKSEIREMYRNEIVACLKDGFRNDCEKVQCIYGGSVAKETANKDSCDVDILCYLSSDCVLPLEEIYEKAFKHLFDGGFYASKKNCAIVVSGKIGEQQWDKTVDVVPGKYIDNTDNDVYLWKNKEKSRLKTNPLKQISKVKESSSKDIIRLIKIFRNKNNFAFKSFYLEIFAIDIVEQKFTEADDLLDKLIKYCESYKEIGNITLFDPANHSNVLNDIHSKSEFEIIQNNLKRLLDALYTDDMEVVLKCLLGESYDLDSSYENSANKTSSKNLNKYLHPVVASPFRIIAEQYDEKAKLYFPFNDYSFLSKHVSLRFTISVNKYLYNTVDCIWVVTNAGYEARKSNCLRGKRENGSVTTDGYNKKYTKIENTLYYGDHFVYAIIKTSQGHEYYTNRVRVRIR